MNPRRIWKAVSRGGTPARSCWIFLKILWRTRKASSICKFTSVTRALPDTISALKLSRACIFQLLDHLYSATTSGKWFPRLINPDNSSRYSSFKVPLLTPLNRGTTRRLHLVPRCSCGACVAYSCVSSATECIWCRPREQNNAGIVRAAAATQQMQSAICNVHRRKCVLHSSRGDVRSSRDVTPGWTVPNDGTGRGGCARSTRCRCRLHLPEEARGQPELAASTPNRRRPGSRRNTKADNCTDPQYTVPSSRVAWPPIAHLQAWTEKPLLGRDGAEKVAQHTFSCAWVRDWSRTINKDAINKGEPEDNGIAFLLRQDWTFACCEISLLTCPARERVPALLPCRPLCPSSKQLLRRRWLFTVIIAVGPPLPTCHRRDSLRLNNDQPMVIGGSRRPNDDETCCAKVSIKLPAGGTYSRRRSEKEFEPCGYWIKSRLFLICSSTTTR